MGVYLAKRYSSPFTEKDFEPRDEFIYRDEFINGLKDGSLDIRKRNNGMFSIPQVIQTHLVTENIKVEFSLKIRRTKDGILYSSIMPFSGELICHDEKKWSEIITSDVDFDDKHIFLYTKRYFPDSEVKDRILLYTYKIPYQIRLYTSTPPEAFKEVIGKGYNRVLNTIALGRKICSFRNDGIYKPLNSCGLDEFNQVEVKINEKIARMGYEISLEGNNTGSSVLIKKIKGET